MSRLTRCLLYLFVSFRQSLLQIPWEMQRTCERSILVAVHPHSSRSWTNLVPPPLSFKFPPLLWSRAAIASFSATRELIVRLEFPFFSVSFFFRRSLSSQSLIAVSECFFTLSPKFPHTQRATFQAEIPALLPLSDSGLLSKENGYVAGCYSWFSSGEFSFVPSFLAGPFVPPLNLSFFIMCAPLPPPLHWKNPPFLSAPPPPCHALLMVNSLDKRLFPFLISSPGARSRLLVSAQLVPHYRPMVEELSSPPPSRDQPSYVRIRAPGRTAFSKVNC